MQGFGYNGKHLFRYELTITTTEHGSSVQTFTKKTRHWVNIVPSSHSQSKNEFGIVANTQQTAIINGTKDFKVGDRLGDATTMLYEVIAVQTFMTNQQLEVRECQTVP